MITSVLVTSEPVRSSQAIAGPARSTGNVHSAALCCQVVPPVPSLLVRRTLEAADRQFGIAPGSPSDMVFIAFERFQADFFDVLGSLGSGRSLAGIWVGFGWV